MNPLRLSIVGVALLTGLAWSGASAQQSTGERSPLQLNVYRAAYDRTDGEIDAVAMRRTLERLNATCGTQDKLDEGDVREILAGQVGILLERCNTQQRVGTEAVADFAGRIMATMHQEQDVAARERILQDEVREQTLFSDARTDNTAYDLMTNLNTLDVIWFGEKASFSRAPWGGYGNPFTLGEYDPADPASLSALPPATPPSGASGNTNGAAGGGSLPGSGGTAGTGSNGNGNGASTGTNGSVPTGAGVAICPVPGLVTGPVADILRGDAPGLRDGSVAPRRTVVDADPRPLHERPYATAVETEPGTFDDGPAPEGRFTSDTDAMQDAGTATPAGEDGNRLLCNAFFCIRVSLHKGVATVANRQDNSIRAHFAAILKALNKLDGYNLNLGSTTSGFLDPGMLNLNFAKNLQLDIFVSRKPVWNPNKHRYGSEEIRQIRAALWPIARRAMTEGCYDLALSVPARTATERATDDADEDCLRVQADWDEAIANAKAEGRKRGEDDLRPLEDEARYMREAIRALLSNFLSSQGIAQQAFELSNKQTK